MTTAARGLRPARDTGTATIGVALIVAAVVVAWGMRWGPDWPAQEFRAWSAAHDGLTLWTNRWYSGTALTGYSLLYPVLGLLLGAPAVGVLAVGAAWLGASDFAATRPRPDRAAYQAAVAFVLLCALLIGQVPFLLGVAFGVWAVRAAARGHPWWSASAALGCSAASPLAGALLLLAVPGLAASVGVRRAATLATASIGVLFAPLLGGAGGPFPFLAKTLVWVLLFGVGLILLSRPASSRWFGWTYALAGVTCFLVANPVAANIARLGQLTALPLLCLLHRQLRVRSRALVVALAALAALWTAWPSVSAALRGADDPTQSRAYYTKLLQHLPTGGRLEVAFTREHWESFYVARAYPLARGWERQTDLAANATLYHRLDPATYRRWLDDNAVSLVALPRAPIDYGGRAEANLLRHPPAYLVPLWHDREWRLWRVRDPEPLASGPATILSLGPDSLRVRVSTAGSSIVRVRASRFWTVTSGRARLGATRDGWLTLTAEHAGLIRVQARLKY